LPPGVFIPPGKKIRTEARGQGTLWKRGGKSKNKNNNQRGSGLLTQALSGQELVAEAPSSCQG